MDMCRMCDGPLEEGRIAADGGRLRWLPEEAGVGVAASRCPRCRMGVFDYEVGALASAADPVDHRSGAA